MTMIRQRTTHSILIAVQLLRLLLFIGGSLVSVNGADGDLLWSDEFDYTGKPLASIWSHDVGNNNGWGNKELQIYTTDTSNAMVQNGILTITTRKNGDTFTSARIKTEGKMSFTYGTLEARIHVPNMDAGLWPCFWTMGEDFYRVGWPKAGEVDIMEMGQGLAVVEGKVNRRVVSAAHWDIFGQYATYAKSYDHPTNLTDGFHIYRLEWTPDTMVTYVDGNWIWEIDITEAQCPSCTELHQPHHILLNMAVGGGFTSGGTSSSAAGSSSSSGCEGSSSSAGGSSLGGCPSRGPNEITAPLPAELKVDWVRLYDNGYTQQVSLPPTPSPTPFPTAVQRLPATPLPTPPPTPIPTPVPTPPPTNPIPVTFAPQTAAPVNRFPYPVEPVNPVNPVGGGKGGKGYGGGGVSGSRSSFGGKGGKGKLGGSRSGTSFGGKGAKGAAGSRSGVSYGKGGKGYARSGTAQGVSGTYSKGKGRWSRSGTTAGTQRTTSDGTPLGTTPAPSPEPTPEPTPFPTPPPVGGFGPMEGDTTETDGDPTGEVPGYSRNGPESLVVQPNNFNAAISSTATATSPGFLSLALAMTVAVGLLTSLPCQFW